MSRSTAVPLVLLLSAMALPAQMYAANPPGGAPKAARAARESKTPPLYVAIGSTSEADLALLRAAIGKLTGVSAVEARAEFDAITVVVDADGRSTQSLLCAAARSVGYDMRQALPRYFAAQGPHGAEELRHLQQVLTKTYGVDKVALNAQPNGAAVRILGVAPTPHLATAAKPLGYLLHPLGTFVVSGSTAEANLSRLRSVLGKVSQVERLELKPLVGGAAILIHGDPKEIPLANAAKTLGYDLWPLSNPSGPRVYRVEPGTADTQKLRQVLGGLEGIGKLELTATAEGQRLSVAGGRVRQDDLLAAAEEAGYTLTSVEGAVALPTLDTDEERSTPPDYVARVLVEKANMGQPAPDFTTLGIDGVTRSSLKDRLALGKPVVLVFGSCSCPRFMAGAAPLERLYQTYKDRVTFSLVYVAESHPGAILAHPKENGEKELRITPLISTEADSMANLRRFVRMVKLTLPAGIESPVDSANQNYSGYPNRIYVITPDGQVVFKGAPGPTGFKVPDLADWLSQNVK